MKKATITIITIWLRCSMPLIACQIVSSSLPTLSVYLRNHELPNQFFQGPCNTMDYSRAEFPNFWACSCGVGCYWFSCCLGCDYSVLHPYPFADVFIHSFLEGCSANAIEAGVVKRTLDILEKFNFYLFVITFSMILRRNNGTYMLIIARFRLHWNSLADLLYKYDFDHSSLCKNMTLCKAWFE